MAAASGAGNGCPVRTRIAPSPTGDPHVGTAYVALFNRALAKHHGGRFVLRIEDTDRARSTSASEARILAALRWLGLDWDEGPDVGGEFGPYRQSERGAVYRRHADQLLAAGKAFRCFCSASRLATLRQEQQAAGETPRYDGRCLGLSDAEAERRIAAGERPVVRLAVPEEGACRFDDGLRGDIEIPWRQVDMQVLVKSDGFPTYHLAVVVDDHLMRISHVLRGEEWISSMPKHCLLYDAFGWPMPRHYHLPLLRNADGSKLSKRRNPTGIDYYRRTGHLPEALVNYLALMGYSMPDQRELFSADDMVAAFDVRRISARGPVFDAAKLSWMNGQYLRALPAETFMARLGEWARNGDSLAALAPLVQQRSERLADALPQVDYLLGDRAAVDAAAFAHKTLDGDGCKRVLDHAGRRLQEVGTWERGALHDALRQLAAGMELSMRDLMAPVFIAIAGRSVALPLFDAMAYLGRDVVFARLRSAIDALGGIGKKEAKRLERAYRTMPAPAAAGPGPVAASAPKPRA